MNASSSGVTRIPVLRSWWASHRTLLLSIAVGLMAVAAVVWLSYEFWRFIEEPTQIGSYRVHPGAIDLKMRHNEVLAWFAGKSVYSEFRDAIYPPASYAILWPLLGWLGVASAKWLWALTTLAALGWLTHLFVSESRADSSLERFFVSLIPFSMYAAGATIGNGQIIVHIMPMLLAGLIILDRGKNRLQADFVSAVLILACLVKPSITAPFVWIVVFRTGSLRPFFLVSAGYASLTLLSASFQEAGLVTLFHDWLARGSEMVVHQAGQFNLHALLTLLGLGEWVLSASFLVLLLLGLWVYFNRHVDLWLLLGVTAILARLWTYHRWYDDLLILLPMLALFRIAKSDHSVYGIDVFS